MLAARKPLWSDELFTYYLARLPSMGDVWGALATGAEQVPPFFYVLTRGSLTLFGASHLSIRLPEVLAFLVMGLCLLAFVKVRSSALFGVLAMALPLLTTARFYSYEARPYALVLAFGAASLLCWRLAVEGPHRKLALFGLGLSLALATSSHYYGVLVVLPLALGELVRSLSSKRLDLWIWAAFAFAAIPLIPFMPLIRGASSYSATFWAKPEWGSMLGFYDWLLHDLALIGFAGILVAAILAASMGKRETREVESSAVPRHELVAAAGFLLLPVVAVTLGKFFTGAFTERYALPAVIGFSVLVPLAAHRLSHRAKPIGPGLVCAFLALAALLFVKDYRDARHVALEQRSTLRFLGAWAPKSSPIVVADPHEFFELSHYAPRALRERLLYLANVKAARAYVGTDTVEKGVLELSRVAPLNVHHYDSFTSRGGHFFVYGKSGEWNWLVRALRRRDGLEQLPGGLPKRGLLRVRAKAPSSSGSVTASA